MNYISLDELVNPTVEGSGSGNAIYDQECIAKLSFNFNQNNNQL